MIKKWRIRQALERQVKQIRDWIGGDPIRMIPLAGLTLEEEDAALARELLRDRETWFDDSFVREYEAAFAEWNRSKHAFAFMGGRVALSAALHALDLSPGDEIIVPGYTCVVVPNAIAYTGAQPVFADIELDTFGLDVDAARKAVNNKTKAILLQHLYGLVCRDYDALIDLAERHDLSVIEDCAHATGATYRGTKVGTRGAIGFYSSERSKVFNTIQGGVAVTDDDALARRIRDFQSKAPLPDRQFVENLLKTLLLQYYESKHKQAWWRGDIARIMYGDSDLISTSDEEVRGIRPKNYGARMPAAVARLGLGQLRRIDSYNEERRRVARQWDQWCEQSGYRPATVIPESEPVFLRYPVMVEAARKLDHAWARRSLGVQVGVWFKGTRHPAADVAPGCPRAAEAVQRCINLPCLMS